MGGDQRHQRANGGRYDAQRADVEDVDLEGHTQQLAQREADPGRQQKECQATDIAANHEMKSGPIKRRQDKPERGRWPRQNRLLIDIRRTVVSVAQT